MTEENQKETLDFLSAHQLPYVCVDEPQGYPSSIPPVVAATSDLAVVRLHGHSDKWDAKSVQERFRYRYGDEELAKWAERPASGRGRRGDPRGVQQLLPRLRPRQCPAAHCVARWPARCWMTWRLMRASMRASCRGSRSGLTASVRPSRLGEVGGHREHLVDGQARRGPARRMQAKPRVVGASGGASKTGARSGPASTSTKMKTATGTPRPARAGRGDRRTARGSSGSSLGELQQQLQPVADRRAEEVVADLGERGRRSASRHASTATGRQRAGLGALDDRHPHGVAPLGPRAVVVAHVVEAEQVRAARTRCGSSARRCGSRRSTSSSGCRPAPRGRSRRVRRAVLKVPSSARGARPRHALRRRDVAGAQRALLGVGGHVRALAGVLLGRAHVDQRVAEVRRARRP